MNLWLDRCAWHAGAGEVDWKSLVLVTASDEVCSFMGLPCEALRKLCHATPAGSAGCMVCILHAACTTVAKRPRAGAVQAAAGA